MSHRGRLSVLCNLLNKPMGTLFDEFNDHDGLDGQEGVVSDVKYHLGARATLTYDEEKEEEDKGSNGVSNAITSAWNPSSLSSSNQGHEISKSIVTRSDSVTIVLTVC